MERVSKVINRRAIFIKFVFWLAQNTYFYKFSQTNINTNYPLIFRESHFYFYLWLSFILFRYAFRVFVRGNDLGYNVKVISGKDILVIQHRLTNE